MEKFTLIENFANKNGGYITLSDCADVGVTKATLASYARQGKLERVKNGVYLLPHRFEDEMFNIQATVPNAIFSHDTALFLHDLTDRDPLQLTVTIPRGYNATNLRKTGAKVYSDIKPHHEVGIVTLKSPYGNDIRAYDTERTLCDCVKPHVHMDVGLITEGFKRYMKREDKNVHKLLMYAKDIGVNERVRRYLEVLL